MADQQTPTAPNTTNIEEIFNEFSEVLTDSIDRLRGRVDDLSTIDRAQGRRQEDEGTAALVTIVGAAVKRAKAGGNAHEQHAIGLRFSGEDDLRTLRHLDEWAKANSITRSRLIVEILNVVMKGG